MLVKLNFSSNKPIVHILQAFNAIINDPSITSAATLETAAVAGWAAGIRTGLQYSTSEIFRTADESKVRSHLSDTNAVTTDIKWTIQSQVHDAPNSHIYFNMVNTVTPALQVQLRYAKDNNITSEMSTRNSSPSVDLNVATNTSGTATSNIGSLFASGPTLLIPSAQLSLITTAWMYLVNDCLILAFTHSQPSLLTGFGNTYNNSVAYTGPFIFSQYDRYDNYNTDTNSIAPLMYTNLAKTTVGAGFGGGYGTSDWSRVENVNAATGADTAFRVAHLVNINPSTTQSFPILSNEQVNWGSGTRNTSQYPLTTQQVGVSTDPSALTMGRLIHTTAFTKFPSADLLTEGFGMLPLRWSNSSKNNIGGVARGGIYIFNGEYSPGDTFTYNGKSYMVWPTWSGYSDRVGLAIPKE